MNLKLVIGFCILLLPLVFADSLTISLRSYPHACNFDFINFTANSAVNINATNGCFVDLDITTLQNVSNASLYIGFSDISSNVPTGYVTLERFVSLEPSSLLNSSLSSFFMRIFYRDGMLSQNIGNVDESSLQIFQWYGGSWHSLDSTVNASGPFVSAQSDSFGVFGLFGRLIIVEGQRISTSGGCYHQWDCSDWSDCVDGFESRICRDAGTCSPFAKILDQRECKVSRLPSIKAIFSSPKVPLPVTTLDVSWILLLFFILAFFVARRKFKVDV